MMRRSLLSLPLCALLALSLAACGGDDSGSAPSAGGGGAGGGSGGGSVPGGGGGGGAGPSTPTAPLYTPPRQVALSTADVQRILAQAIEEARMQALPAVIAITDRVGNVLAVYSMTGARETATLRAGTAGNTGLQGVAVPATTAAIAKALTGAYLSSSGNAFSSRTASMIVQEHFPPSPATAGLEGGPLFGVQFSALPCSDIVRRFDPAGGATSFIGPKRSPLGLSADPGGLPLYKDGVVVGGIGVMADGDYGFDRDVTDRDWDVEEFIAMAGATGFDAPAAIRADRIAIDGTTLRYVDGETSQLKSNPAHAGALASLPGALVAVAGYFSGSVIVAGQAYGSEASGVRPVRASEFSNSNAYVLSDGNGTNRYPIRAGTDAADVGTALSEAETRAILEEAFTVMTRARGQIRQPHDSRAQVSISIVDSRGVVLGFVRGPDAPTFGIDVAVQKARTAAFLSNPSAAADLSAASEADVRGTVAQARGFLNANDALTGKFAITSRAAGNLARPYFPDGEVGRGPGPLSVPIAQFSPFATGLQSALIASDVATHVGFVASGGASADVGQSCTSLPQTGGRSRLANGLQIFPGSVPIYRGNVMVGAIGVSGDGIDQDDMTAFLGTHNAGVRVGGIANAPYAIRSDQILVSVGGRSVRLRYVACPFAPFLDDRDQSACSGK